MEEAVTAYSSLLIDYSCDSSPTTISVLMIRACRLPTVLRVYCAMPPAMPHLPLPLPATHLPTCLLYCYLLPPPPSHTLFTRSGFACHTFYPLPHTTHLLPFAFAVYSLLHHRTHTVWVGWFATTLLPTPFTCPHRHHHTTPTYFTTAMGRPGYLPSLHTYLLLATGSTACCP